jgi:TRAP-type C4-dicarboxylate transport system permease small subunit
MAVLKFLDDNFEKIISTCLMIFFVALCCWQVLTRYMLKSLYIIWSEEIARYSFIFCMYLAFSWTVKTRSILRVEILDGFLGKKAKYAQEIFVGLVVIAASVVMLGYSFSIFMTQVKMGQLLPASRLPMFVVWVSFPLAFALTILRQIQLLFRAVKTMKNGDEPICQ